MPVVFRNYGKTIEITEFEKEPVKVRVRASRKRRTVYGPRRLDNMRRTRKICLRRVLSALEDFGCPLLVTLTFSGDASDASFANRSLRVFQVRLRDKFPNAQSLFVPELSPRGRIHFHGLLFNVPLHLGDTRNGRRSILHGTERKTRILASLWGEGFVDARKTDGSPRLAHYISKYLTKAGGEVMFNAMHMLRISQGFPKETVLRGVTAETFKEVFDKKVPDRVWEGKNAFLGKITKRTYYGK